MTTQIDQVAAIAQAVETFVGAIKGYRKGVFILVTAAAAAMQTAAQSGATLSPSKAAANTTGAFIKGLQASETPPSDETARKYERMITLCIDYALRQHKEAISKGDTLVALPNDDTRAGKAVAVAPLFDGMGNSLPDMYQGVKDALNPAAKAERINKATTREQKREADKEAAQEAKAKRAQAEARGEYVPSSEHLTAQAMAEKAVDFLNALFAKAGGGDDIALRVLKDIDPGMSTLTGFYMAYVETQAAPSQSQGETEANKQIAAA